MSDPVYQRLVTQLKQCDAELLMAAQFLNEAGTDPAAWIDGVRQRLRRLAEELLASPPPDEPPPCEWHLDDIGEDSVWETTCGHAFQFNDGGPAENHMAFCGYCGKKLMESRRSDDEAAPPDEPEAHPREDDADRD